MKIIEMDINKIIPYENNPRINDKAIDKVAESIKQFGFKQPIVLDENNIIIVGHTRLKASKKLDLKNVPVIIANDLTEEQIKAYRLADNKTSEFADWDMEKLNIELEELNNLDFDMSEFGFDLNYDLENKNIEIKEDDFDVNKEIEETKDKEPITKKNMIYKLGNHRLMCGDGTKEDDVKLLMDDNKVDMIFTDPPYKIETKGGCKGNIGKSLKKQGNNIEFISNFNPNIFLEILKKIFVKDKKINAYIFCNKDLLPEYLNFAVKNKISYNVLIWKKPNAIPIGDSHRPDIEYLILFRKNAIWNNGLKNVNYSRCLEYNRETGLHPTMKPLKLISNEIYISSNKNSIVLDLFGGSGSTLIACEQTNRKCFMMELDEKYCDVIIKRWEDYTGKKAELLNE